MADIVGRVRQARIALMRRAAERWVQHAPAREDGLEKIRARGIGAADTPAQQQNWTTRQALRSAGAAARFAERIIGPNDLVPFAPSVRAAAVAAPVARITTLPDATHRADGFASGLLLPGQLLLTNFHVFPGPAYAAGCAANFGHARDDRGIAEGSYFEFDAQRFFIADEAFDFAIVAVKPAGTRGEALEAIGATRLIEATGKILTGHPVNIVQHPDGGPRQFGITNNRLLEILEEGFLHYETDTDRGSSGSPVFNADWELIALHHSGIPRLESGQIMKRNGAGPWDEAHDPESEIDWVANEGIRVSFIVSTLRTKRAETAPQQALLEGLIASTADPLEARPATLLAGGVTPPLVMAPAGVPGLAGTSMVFSGPVTIHVYAPVAPSGPAGAPPSAPGIEPAFEKALIFDEDYTRRSGYDAKFLGVEIGLPGAVPARAAELYSVADYRRYFDEYRDVPALDTTGLRATDAMLLRYLHYTLAFNKKHRMCLWTASNVDYGAASRQDTRSRAALGAESWRYDPRVPRELQLADPDVYSPARRVDRGHIVRREDNCWGPAGLPTDHANADTYHWTNCTPQHEAFNQENPMDRSGLKVYTGTGTKGIWGAFEDALADQIVAGGGKAVLFAGPVLADFFRPQDWGRGKVNIPKRFWKVVVVPASMRKQPRLLAYGYLFDQTAVVTRFGLDYERLDLPGFVRSRASLADIAARTGVVFAPAVLAAEQPVAT